MDIVLYWEVLIMDSLLSVFDSSAVLCGTFSFLFFLFALDILTVLSSDENLTDLLGKRVLFQNKNKII